MLNGKNQVISKLTTGSFFGDLGFIFHCRRTATIVASTDAILVVLTKEKLNEALAHHPDQLHHLKKFEDERKEWYTKQNYSTDEEFGGKIRFHNLLTTLNRRIHKQHCPSESGKDWNLSEYRR